MKIVQFLSLLHVSTSFDGIMRLFCIKFPIGLRKITVTLEKIATITFLDTSCQLLTVFFLDKGNIFSGRAKFFNWGALPSMPAPGFVDVTRLCYVTIGECQVLCYGALQKRGRSGKRQNWRYVAGE